MGRNSRKAKDRRPALLESLKEESSGGLTAAGAKLIVASIGGIEFDCTITHFCRTSVFEFPGSHLNSEEVNCHHVIFESETLKAVIVSDLLEYFEQRFSPFPHYSTDVSLRAGIEGIASRNDDQGRTTLIFLVVEQYEKIPQPTTFDNGECFQIDEVHEGREVIEGGRAGKQALSAFKISNRAWPEFDPDVLSARSVLATIKIEQDITHPITELYSCDCFVSEDGRAVYPRYSKMSIAYGGLRVSKPVSADDLPQKVERLCLIHDGLKREVVKSPQMAELVDSILLDNTKEDAHFRLWYLRLWQAADDARKLLGAPKLWAGKSIIAGNHSPQELKDYRGRIAHWWTGRVDYSFVTSLQLTVLELLRRKFCGRDSL